MTLTSRRLNRATLGRQILLAREPLGVPGAVRRIVALQAQEAVSPYLALWNRIHPFDPADLDAAFADRSVVRATLMRATLHAVHAEDHPAFHAAMVHRLRQARLGDVRFTGSGLTAADADELLGHLLDFVATPRTKVEIEDMFEARLGHRHPGPWWALRTFAPLTYVPTGGPWSFGGRASVTAARARPRPEGQEASVRWLVRRYLSAFGPASVPDLGQFSLLTRPVIRDAVRTSVAAGEVAQLDRDLYDVPDGPLPDEDVPAPPRLLPMWDSVLLAYSDRGRVIPAQYRRIVIRGNGDVLPTLLVDGYVAGVWRPVEGGVEATAFHRLPDDAWDGLAAEAASLLALLADREPLPYRRFAHWWTKLPEGHVRVLR